MFAMKQPPSVFPVFRVLFGLYLAVFFASLIPFSRDLFTPGGILPIGHALPFPGYLRFVVHESSVRWSLLFFTGLSVLYALGLQRRICALLLWYGYASLVNRLPIVTVPSQGYVGWLLLASALVPGGEPFSLSRRKPGWEMPAPLLFGGWMILALGYSFSGVDKLGSPSWMDGTALSRIFESPVVFSGWRKTFLLSLPAIVTKGVSWFALWLEILYAPLCLSKITRKWAWLIMVFFHIVILVTFNIRSVTFGMLLAHFFVFDPLWLPSRWRQRFDASRSHLEKNSPIPAGMTTYGHSLSQENRLID
jgi:hypothetical protein